MFFSKREFFPSQLGGRRRHKRKIDVRAAGERDTPVRHWTFGIELRCLLKGTDGRAVIESVKKSEALIEITLRFRRVGSDLARIGAEPIVERFLRCIQVGAGQCQRRPDNDLGDFGRRFHKWSRQTIRRIVSGNR